MSKNKKKISSNIMRISILFIPVLITLLIVSSHSHELITRNISIVIYLLLCIAVFVFLISLIFYIKNYEKKIKKRNRLLNGLYLVFVSVYIIGCISFLTLLYGPNTKFKDWLVTTAMATMNHKKYCMWFYNQKEIDEVFSRNYIEEPEGSSDEDLITTSKIEEDVVEEKKIEYANEYEEAVLTKNDENDIYKIINLEVNGCKAYLAVIYDPSMVHVTTTDKVGVRGQYVTTMAKRENAYVAINGAGFYDPNYSSSGGCPKGITIVNGKVVTNNEYGRAASGGLIGLTKDNKLVLLRNITAKEALDRGIRDAVSWGPFLIVNGKAAYTKGNGGWGYAARTAIGQRADGIILFLVVDSNYNRTKGADMGDMTDIMVKYGAINATNLDGGTSSVMAVNGELISHPINSSLKNETRPIATAFVVRK